MLSRTMYGNSLSHKPYGIVGSLSPPTPGTLVAQGVNEAEKEKIKGEEINKERFLRLVKASTETLLKISSVFPFDFFTDEVSIEVTQINVIKRNFFLSAHLQTIPVKNIADVFVQTSIFFASLHINDSSYIENSIQVDNLKKNEAFLARRIIQGLVVANKEGIDLAKVPKETLMAEIENLGKALEVDISQ
jgi:hypothetical protein